MAENTRQYFSPQLKSLMTSEYDTVVVETRN
jgi:hypothetical protein